MLNSRKIQIRMGKKFNIPYIYRQLTKIKILRRFMSVLEKYNSAFMNKDEAAMNEVLA